MVEDKELKRGLSLPMAIFIIIGMVIGASIWVNPAAYLNRTGPAIFLAYIIAVIPAIFIAYLSAYLGSAFPVAGGTYVITSRLTGGFGGFMSV
jgi:APA family basic amino acid/polyamine antiporter